MRKSFLLALSLVISACATTAPGVSPRSGSLAGAAAPRLAVEQFLNAVRAQDLQAMGAIWGTSRGPARETIERTELEKRVIILQCYLAHDSFRILNEVPGEAGRRVIRVELVRGKDRRQPNIYTVPGPGGRWYVENVEIAAVRDFCGTPLPSR